MVGGVLALVGLASVLCPLADAAIRRRAELAADRFAADHGLALELAAALHALNDGHRAARGWSQRLLASHPTSDHRIRALLAGGCRFARLSCMRDDGPIRHGPRRPPQRVAKRRRVEGSGERSSRPRHSSLGTLYAPNTPVLSRPQPTQPTLLIWADQHVQR